MRQRTVQRLLDRYRVTDGKRFRLKDYDCDDTAPKLIDPADADALLAAGVTRLAELQALLATQRSWGVLAIFQAMDAAGKDGTIGHVMSGVNPQGVDVTAFKAPGPEELDHDYLWRVARRLPPRGKLGIFNRSHYEEVLVVRVHPELLERQQLPDQHAGKHIWRNRLTDIANFESYLARQGLVILKFFLHVSPAEQKRRLLDRLDHPGKNWKFNAGDITERRHWDEYMAAYEDAIQATASKAAPWYVIPADHKWFARLVVVTAMIAALEALDLHAPRLSETDRAGLAAAREELLRE